MSSSNQPILRLLMLAPDPQTRGPIGKHTGYLIKELESLGCTVDRLPWGNDGGDVSSLRRLSIRVSQVWVTASKLRGRRFDALILKTAHDWKTLSRDLPMIAAARAMRTPVVIQFHGSQPDMIEPAKPWDPFTIFSRLLARIPRGLLVLSEEERTDWSTRTRAHRVLVVRNPYVTRFPSRSFDSTDHGPGTVLFVGRVLREKGILELIKAMAHAPASQWKLRVVGEGPALDEATLLADAEGVQMAAVGYLSGDPLDQEYINADVLALPTYWREGFPTVISEAMDAGLAIITTQFRGVADWLQDGSNVAYVRPQSPDDVAQALGDLENVDVRQRMAKANRALLTNFEPREVADHYLSSLRTLLG
jgi:glycosyltransferase involved in cell wall biosynthesis